MIQTVYVVIGDDTELVRGDEMIGDKWLVGVFTSEELANDAIGWDTARYKISERNGQYGELGHFTEKVVLDSRPIDRIL